MRWSVPAFPVAPAGDHAEPPSVVTVDDAFLTRVEHGPLATPTPPRALAARRRPRQRRRPRRGRPRSCASARNNWVAADPGTGRGSTRRPSVLPGRWLYGGHWMQHFGHFLAETLTTLWPPGPTAGRRAGLPQVPQAAVGRGALAAAAARPRRVRRRAGAGRRRARRALRVEQLVVPGRSVVAHGWAHPQAREVWERVAAPLRRRAAGSGGPARVFLSRTGHNEARRDRGAPLGRAQHRRPGPRRRRGVRGGRVRGRRDPRRCTIDDQLRLVADAEVVAGPSGSALHLSAFAPTARGSWRSATAARRTVRWRCSWSSTRRAGTSTRSCAATRRSTTCEIELTGVAGVTAERIGRAQVMRRLLAHYDAAALPRDRRLRGRTFDRVPAAGQGRRRPGVPLRPHRARAAGARARATTRSPATSTSAPSSTPDAQFDVIYLDGLHTVEQTLRDLLNALPHLQPQGVIVIDDVRPPTDLAAHPGPPGVLRGARAPRAATTRRRGWATSSGSSTSSTPSASSCRYRVDRATTTARPSCGGTAAPRCPQRGLAEVGAMTFDELTPQRGRRSGWRRSARSSARSAPTSGSRRPGP